MIRQAVQMAMPDGSTLRCDVEIDTVYSPDVLDDVNVRTAALFRQTYGDVIRWAAWADAQPDNEVQVVQFVDPGEPPQEPE